MNSVCVYTAIQFVEPKSAHCTLWTVLPNTRGSGSIISFECVYLDCSNRTFHYFLIWS